MVDCRLRQFYKLGSDRLSGCLLFCIDLRIHAALLQPCKRRFQRSSFLSSDIGFCTHYCYLGEISEAESKEKHGVWDVGSYAGVDYNLTLCPLQSRLQRSYHGQHYARVDFNPMPESALSPSQGLWIWPPV